MVDVLISTRGRIVLPVAIRKSLELTPGMRVNVKVHGSAALITPVTPIKTVSLKDIQKLIKYEGLTVTIESMRFG